MKVTNIGSYKTEVQKSNGDLILVSYSTPVAALIDGQYYRTSTRWSVTTSKHINQWIGGADAIEKEQLFFDTLI